MAWGKQWLGNQPVQNLYAQMKRQGSEVDKVGLGCSRKRPASEDELRDTVQDSSGRKRGGAQEKIVRAQEQQADTGGASAAAYAAASHAEEPSAEFLHWRHCQDVRRMRGADDQICVEYDHNGGTQDREGPMLHGAPITFMTQDQWLHFSMVAEVFEMSGDVLPEKNTNGGISRGPAFTYKEQGISSKRLMVCHSAKLGYYVVTLDFINPDEIIMFSEGQPGVDDFPGFSHPPLNT